MSRPLLAIRAALAVIVIAPTAWAAQPVREATNALAMARSEAAQIAAAYGWTETLPIVDGPALDTSATRISLGADAVAALVATTGNDLSDAVRMVVAHEVWHYVELQRDPAAKGAAASDDRRVYECRADLMAARYLSRHGGTLWRPNKYSSQAERVAQALWTSVSADHPRPRQRVMAARFGALSVLRETPGVTAEDLREVNAEIDYVEGEPFDGWTRRVCRMITHHGGGALAQLVVEAPRIEARGSETQIEITYVNPAGRAVEIETILSILHSSPSTGTEPPVYTSWHVSRSLSVDPWCRTPLRLTLPGLLDPERFTITYELNNERTLVSGRFDGAFAVPGSLPLGPNMTQEDIVLAGALQRLANDALNSFTNNRSGGGRLSSDSLWFRSAVQIPGPLDSETNILINRDGAASVVRTLFMDPSRERAAAYFASFQAALRRIWPTLEIRVEPYGEGIGHFIVPIARFARIEVSTFLSSGNHTVYFQMKPNPLGLVTTGATECSTDRAATAAAQLGQPRH